MRGHQLFTLTAAAAISSCALSVSACGADPWVLASERTPNDAPALPPPRMGGFAGGVPQCEEVRDLQQQRAARSRSKARLDAAHLGTWRGELSGDAAAGFPAKDVELELRSDATGSLSFDGVPPPPEPESNDGGYLCDGRVSGGVCGSVSGFVGGFAYALEAPMSRGSVLSFSIVDADPWEAWCNLQTPLARPEPFFDCGIAFEALPPGSERWSPDGCWTVLDTGTEPIDCGRMYSLERCQCARDGCIASFAERVEVGLRLTDTGELAGSLWFKNETDAASIRLHRD